VLYLSGVSDDFGSALTQEEAVPAGVVGPGASGSAGLGAGVASPGVGFTAYPVGSGGGGGAIATTTPPATAAAAAANAPTSGGGGTLSGVPSIPARIMRVVGSLGAGSFGTVDLVDIRGVTYASKRTSTRSRDGEALARELAIYNRVHRQPHPHIMPLYGVCTDHGDGLVRLVMRRAVCSLEELLKEARGQVG
jgi:hypothetical protein